jgi:hypothetical protein
LAVHIQNNKIILRARKEQKRKKKGLDKKQTIRERNKFTFIRDNNISELNSPSKEI